MSDASDDLAAALENTGLSVLSVAELRFLQDAADLLRRQSAALEYARPLVEKWCHYQGDNAQFFADTLAPIDAALGRSQTEHDPAQAQHSGDDA